MSNEGAEPARRRKRRTDVDAADRESWPEILTLGQVAKILAISEVSARRFVEQGEIEAVKFGGQWRVPRRWLVRRFRLDEDATGDPDDTTDHAGPDEVGGTM